MLSQESATPPMGLSLRGVTSLKSCVHASGIVEKLVEWPVYHHWTFGKSCYALGSTLDHRECR